MVYRVCPGPPTQRRDFDYLRPLQSLCGCGRLVGHKIAGPTNGVRFSALAPFSSGAGVAQGEEGRIRNAEVGVSRRCSGFVTRKSQFDSGAGRRWFDPSFPDQIFCGQVNRCHAGLIRASSTSYPAGFPRIRHFRLFATRRREALLPLYSTLLASNHTGSAQQ